MWTQLIVRIPLAVAGTIAAYCMSADNVHFDLVRTAIVLAMFAAFVSLLIAAPLIWHWCQNRGSTDDPSR